MALQIATASRPLQAHSLRKAYPINIGEPDNRRQLSTIQLPSSPIFTAPSGTGKMGGSLSGNGGERVAFFTAVTNSAPALYLSSNNVNTVVKTGTVSTSFDAASIATLPNGNDVLLYTQQQGSVIKVYGRQVTSVIGTEVEIGVASTSTKHISLFQVGTALMVMWDKSSSGIYQAQPVTSSLQPTGSFLTSYGTNNYPYELSTQLFEPIVFLKETSGLATASYVVRKSDGIYVGTATASGLGTPTKISPAGTAFSCPDITKAPDGTIVAVWGQRDASKNVVLAQKLSSSLSPINSPITVFTSILSSSDPLAAKVKGFSDGFLVVVSNYGSEFNMVHLSKAVGVTGSPQALSGSLSPTVPFSIQGSSANNFGIGFFAHTSTQTALTSSPNLYRISGTFSLPAAGSPSAAPTMASGPGQTGRPTFLPTPSPTIQTVFIGSPQNQILVGTDADDTFVGYVGGETTMTGNYGQNTFVIIKGSGKDEIMDFALSNNKMDLRQVHITDFSSLLASLDDPLSVQKKDNPEGGDPIYEVQTPFQNVTFHFGERQVVLQGMYALVPDSFIYYKSSGSGSEAMSSTVIGGIVGGVLGSIGITAGVITGAVPIHPPVIE